MKDEVIQRWTELNDQLKGYIFSQVKDEEQTRDILQETFIKVYTNIGSLRNRDKIIPWIFTIARNEVKRSFRLNKKMSDLQEPEADDRITYNHRLEKCILPFIEALPPKYQEAVKMVELENLPQKELAKKLDISYSGAKSRVQRGREQLKGLLEECCHIQHDAYGNILEIQKKKTCGESCD